MFRFKKQSSGKLPHNIGFYAALAVCLVAIGASAWATADSIIGLQQATVSGDLSGSISRTENASSLFATNRPVSGVPMPESSSSQAVSSKPAPVSSKGELVSSALPTNHPITPSSKPSDTVSPPPSSAADPDPKTLIMPINGRILKPFSESAYSMTFSDWRAHYGVDIAANKGATVMAIGEGNVTEVRQDDMLGTVVVIQHGSLEVHYCGLGNNPSVRVGDSVICGQVLGVIADIPSETVEETHLHLQIRKNGMWIEPLAAIGKEDKLPSESVK